jgi:hypothetical protein
VQPFLYSLETLLDGWLLPEDLSPCSRKVVTRLCLFLVVGLKSLESFFGYVCVTVKALEMRHKRGIPTDRADVVMGLS